MPPYRVPSVDPQQEKEEENLWPVWSINWRSVKDMATASVWWGNERVYVLRRWMTASWPALDPMLPAYANNSVETESCSIVRFPTLDFCFNDYAMSFPGRLLPNQWNWKCLCRNRFLHGDQCCSTGGGKNLGGILRTNYSFSNSSAWPCTPVFWFNSL